jgi:hypothetical protein
MFRAAAILAGRYKFSFSSRMRTRLRLYFLRSVWTREGGAGGLRIFFSRPRVLISFGFFFEFGIAVAGSILLRHTDKT